MTTCSICLEQVRSTRSNQPLRCGHLFHSQCLDGWKGHTCPICRKVFDASCFKIVVTIQNNHTEQSNSVSLNETAILDVLDLTFDIDTTMDLTSILADLGMSLSDFDTRLFDTE